MNNIVTGEGGIFGERVKVIGSVAFDMDFIYFIFFQDCAHARRVRYKIVKGGTF